MPNLFVHNAEVFVAASLITIVGLTRLKRSSANYTFTASIIAVTIFALLFPQRLTTWGNFQFSTLIIPLLQVSMFTMGASLHYRDLINVIKMPRVIGVGLFCQLTVMPLVGLMIGLGFQFSPEVAAGVVLLGCSPSGVTSNVMTYIAKGNLALSISLTSVGTLLAPFTTPYLMFLLAGEIVPIDTTALMISIVKMVIFPVLAGLVFNLVVGNNLAKLRRAMPGVAMFAITLIIGIVTAAGREQMLQIGVLLALAAVIHNLFGFFLGYRVSLFMGASKQNARTIALEVGLQNSGLASGLAHEMGKLATMGLPSVIFSSWMNLSGSLLSNWWRNQPLDADDKPAIRDDNRH